MCSLAPPAEGILFIYFPTDRRIQFRVLHFSQLVSDVGDSLISFVIVHWNLEIFSFFSFLFFFSFSCGADGEGEGDRRERGPQKMGEGRN